MTTRVISHTEFEPSSRGNALHSRNAPIACEPLSIDGKFFRRGFQRIRLRGVTYGPFCPNDQGDPFPHPDVVRDDLQQMCDAGVNVIRTYHLPPSWLIDLVGEAEDVGLLIDVPWSKHICFLDSAWSIREARQNVEKVARAGAAFPWVWAYSIGNEIPADVVRWHGARRVERFLGELADVARQADPHGLVTYASFPPTEYLDLSALDFLTFNLYLHDRATFRRYLLRLQHLVDGMPLVLGEIGMDTLREGELAQAKFLQGHLAEAALAGLAGQFVFSWTDDWFTGGHAIEDWAFGITDRSRTPKAGYFAVKEMFGSPIVELLSELPRVSVVVCSYNGGATLESCLDSLERIQYPDYEVIVVNDGSTDHTRDILKRFASVKVVDQPNRGLSAARNAGLHAATGSIIAYTDSDCFVDPDWLTLLVAQLESTGADGVGGPNLAPEDGRLAGCVAAAPGQPSHVLESDQVAEHIPGCNMAFRRDALLAINGFDDRFRKAGDDVDVCWRLQQAGFWISFAPGAFVWHHRRQSPRAYLRQQSGYGEAEALLRFKHPHRFNDRGHGVWRGVVYGVPRSGPAFDDAIIYRGAFGTGMFQCIYQPGPAHWMMLPATLEWHVAAATIGVLGFAFSPLWLLCGTLLAASLFIAAMQGAQAKIAPAHDGPAARLLVAVLCYAQPLVRSWARYRTRYFNHRTSNHSALERGTSAAWSWVSPCVADFWRNNAPERTEVLAKLIDYLAERRCGVTVDSGWSDWDLEVFSDPCSLVHVRTVQEEHGEGERLIRVRCSWQLSRLSRTIGICGTTAALAIAPISPHAAIAVAAFVSGGALFACYRGAALASRIGRSIEQVAENMGLVHCVDHDSRELPSTFLPQALLHAEANV